MSIKAVLAEGKGAEQGSLTSFLDAKEFPFLRELYLRKFKLVEKLEEIK